MARAGRLGAAGGPIVVPLLLLLLGSLTAAWDRYSDQGVVLVGVDFQDRRGPALEFMREIGGGWPVVEDPGGRTALDYGVAGVPETFFIGRDGVIRFKQIGPSSYEVLTDQIQRILGQDVPNVMTYYRDSIGAVNTKRLGSAVPKYLGIHRNIADWALK